MLFLGINLSLASRLLSSTATPASLFNQGEVGVWFDSTDITTLYQDIHALTPVTAPGQTCALMLDKSKGLAQGPQLADVNTQTLSQATGARSGAGWSLTATANFPTVAQPGTPITTGKLYRVSFAWSGNDELRTVAFNIGGEFIASLGATGSGSVTRTVMATGTGTVQIYTTNSVAGDTLYLEITSVTEVQGNHAQQATAAQRPTYGVIPYGGIRNFIPYSSDLSQASWAKGTECSVSNSGQLTPNGNTAWLATFSGTTSNAVVYDTGHAVSVGQIVTFSGWVKAGTAQDIYLRIANGDATILQAVNITPTATWTRFSVTATVTVAGSLSFGQVRGSTTTAGTVLVGDFQYEYSASQTPFQKTVTKYNTTEAGKATVGALFADGIDDVMVTPSIDFSGTDKMTVWAGVQKLSDAAQAVLLELSANSGTTPNSFSLQAPGPGVSFRLVSAGSATGSGIADATGFPAPTARVLTGIGDISGDRATLQVNGLQVAQSTADQGTGNYSNNPVYLFRRGGTTLPFNGIFTGLIARGAASTQTQIDLGNNYLNSKLGAY